MRPFISVDLAWEPAPPTTVPSLQMQLLTSFFLYPQNALLFVLHLTRQIWNLYKRLSILIKKIERPTSKKHKNSKFIYRCTHNYIQMIVPITCMDASQIKDQKSAIHKIETSV
jgi:hypothetical protein